MTTFEWQYLGFMAFVLAMLCCVALYAVHYDKKHQTKDSSDE